MPVRQILEESDSFDFRIIVVNTEHIVAAGNKINGIGLLFRVRRLEAVNFLFEQVVVQVLMCLFLQTTVWLSNC